MIDVIIVNYRCAQLTQKSVFSVLNESEKTTIYVIDNSDDADEAALLKELLPSSVTLIINGNNVGFGQACNLAYDCGNAEMVLLLNPDAYLLPGCLTQLKQALQSHPNTAAVGPKVFWDDERQYLLPPSLLPTPAAVLRGELWRIFPWFYRYESLAFRKRAERVWTSHQPIQECALSGGNVLLSRKKVDESGGLFDERYFMYYEDSDLILRLRKLGYKFFVIPSAECVHTYEHHVGKMALMERAQTQYYNKNFKNSFLLQCSNWLRKLDFLQIKQEFQQLGTIQKSPQFVVPSELQEHWLMEISPSPTFIPAIGHFGSGGTAKISEQCWQLLHEGHYFCRIGPAKENPRKFQLWQWVVG